MLLDDLYQIPKKQIKSLEWQGDHLWYDLQLYSLGEGHDEFWALNPEFDNVNLDHWIKEIPYTRKCIVYSLNGTWVVKLFKDGWYPYHGYETIEIPPPSLFWQRNTDLDSRMTFVDDPRSNYQINYWDMDYELVWNMDSKLLPDDTPVWVYKAKFIGYEVLGSKIVNELTPKLEIQYNPELPDFNVDLESLYPYYYNLDHDNLYMLDRKHCPWKKVWVVKFSPAYRKTKGQIHVGTITPEVTIETNDDILAEIVDPTDSFSIPYYDFSYKHVWYAEHRKEKIWAVKAYLGNPVAEKDMGMIEYNFENKFDVVFISYNEPNAEKNWQRVLEKAPWAKRVDGVKGIFNAHRKAAKLSTTEMFYVVDGDAYLTDDWEFNFDPGLFDRDCAYVWLSQNPINDLVYENGGVKLFSKNEMLKVRKWRTLDMYTGVTAKKKVLQQPSCLTTYNSDEFSTWRTAFRESVKLFVGNKVSYLNTWMTKGEDRPYGEYSIKGAHEGYKFAKRYAHRFTTLSKINNYTWLRKKFERSVKVK